MNARARRPAPRLPATQTLSLLPELPVAPAPSPSPARALEPTPVRPAPPPALSDPDRRDFAAPVERVVRGQHLVVRARTTDGYGYQIYRAFERADVFFYGETLDELTWGRIDTRRSLRSYDPVREYGDAVIWQMACAAEAREVIRTLCPETRLASGERAPDGGVYDGPGYILLLTDPAFRYQVVLAARATEAARREAFDKTRPA